MANNAELLQMFSLRVILKGPISYFWLGNRRKEQPPARDGTSGSTYPCLRAKSFHDTGPRNRVVRRAMNGIGRASHAGSDEILSPFLLFPASLCSSWRNGQQRFCFPTDATSTRLMQWTTPVPSANFIQTAYVEQRHNFLLCPNPVERFLFADLTCSACLSLSFYVRFFEKKNYSYSCGIALNVSLMVL